MDHLQRELLARLAQGLQAQREPSQQALAQPALPAFAPQVLPEQAWSALLSLQALALHQALQRPFALVLPAFHYQHSDA